MDIFWGEKEKNTQSGYIIGQMQISAMQ